MAKSVAERRGICVVSVVNYFKGLISKAKLRLSSVLERTDTDSQYIFICFLSRRCNGNFVVVAQPAKILTFETNSLAARALNTLLCNIHLYCLSQTMWLEQINRRRVGNP